MIYSSSMNIDNVKPHWEKNKNLLDAILSNEIVTNGFSFHNAATSDKYAHKD